MEEIGALRAELSANAAQFDADMKAARNSMKSATSSMRFDLKSMQKEADNLVSKMVSVKGSIALVSGATGLYLLASRSIRAADDMGKVADRVGFTAEQLQEVQFAARHAGMEIDDTNSTLQKFTKNVAEAAAGDKSLRNEFAQLGISAADLKQKSPHEIFRMVADAISRIDDPAQRLRVTLDLFGKGGGQWVNVFKNGAAGLDDAAEAARRLGIVLSNETIAKAQQASDELDDMEAVVTRAGMGLGLALIPPMRELAKLMTDPNFIHAMESFGENLAVAIDWMVRNKEVITTVAGAWSGFAVAGPWGAAAGGVMGYFVPGALKSEWQRINEEIEQYKKEIIDIGRVASEGTNPNSVDAFNEQMRLRAKIQVLEARKAFLQGPPQGAASGGGPKLPSIDMTGQADETSKLSDKAADLTSSLHGENDALAQNLALLSQGKVSITQMADAIAMQNEATQKGIDLKSEAGIEWVAEWQRNKELERSYADVKKIVEDTITPQELYNAQLQRLNELKPYLTADQYARAIAHAKDELDKANNQGGKTSDMARELGMTFESAFENAIVNGGKLRDVLKGIYQDIVRIILRQSVTTPLANLTSSFSSSMVSSAGSWLGSLFGGGKASGGDVIPGTTYLVGENGPELFSPKGRGTIIPNHELGGPRGVAITMHLHGVTDMKGFRQSESQIATTLSRAVSRGQRNL